MYKILSLDGGGSWAILQLLTLKEKYGNVKGHEILRKYDLVIANSGGSIVLAALAENWLLDRAIRLFKDEANRKLIFHRNTFMERFFPVNLLRFGALGPRYSSAKKREAFRHFFVTIDNKPLQELPRFIGKESLKIVVCTYDALGNRAKFFRSFNEDGGKPDSVTLTDAVHGSSNAPVQYFDFPAEVRSEKNGKTYQLWDGALGGFNNPVLAGIIEAIKAGVSKEDIHVVSIGTGSKVMTIKEQKEFLERKEDTQTGNSLFLKPWHYFMDIVFYQAKTILFEPPDWANYVTMMFLDVEEGDEKKSLKHRFIRLSPLIHEDKSMAGDDYLLQQIRLLYDLDMDLTRDEDIRLIEKCFDLWKAGRIKNQPIAYSIKPDNEIEYKFGERRFEDAMGYWEV